LPADTSIYCAHEYTLKNIDFSLQYLRSQKADSHTLNGYEQLRGQLLAKREHNEPTVPTNLGFELEYNLFLRAPNLEEFTEMRRLRNEF
jgi:hydroxyacylglutathione hydrolase